jgi:hypothetical protein
MKGLLVTAAAIGFPRTMWADQATEGDMMETFRQVGLETTRQVQINHKDYVGGFPPFCKRRDPMTGKMKGVAIFIGAGFADWKDVELSELGNVSLNDFAGRMRAAHNYATSHNYLAGFPNFFDAPTGPSGQRRVCGTILIKNQPSLPGVNPSPVIVRNLSLAELGNVNLNDSLARFKAVQKYAKTHGFAGGYPTMHQTDLTGQESPHAPRRILYGTVLFASKTFEPIFAPLSKMTLFSDCPE